MEANPALLERPPTGSEPTYSIIFAPGNVRYLSLTVFLNADVEAVITHLKRVYPCPIIKDPALPRELKYFGFTFDDVNELLEGELWENRLRIHHALGRLFFEKKVPSGVYCEFHALLQLGKNFNFGECQKSWMKEVGENHDLIESYLSSSEHMVSRGFVFKITEFVKRRLDEIAKETAQQAAENARREAAEREQREKEQELQNFEALRKSRFDTFVYIMEDLRNAAFKIGHSKTPDKRERTLQSEVPAVTLRFSIPADENHEQQLHAQFDHKNQRGEWFSLTADELLTVISFLKANGDASRATVDYEWLGRLYFQSAFRTGGA